MLAAPPAVVKPSTALLAADPFGKHLRKPVVLRTLRKDCFSVPCLLVLAVVPTQSVLPWIFYLPSVVGTRSGRPSVGEALSSWRTRPEWTCVKHLGLGLL